MRASDVAFPGVVGEPAWGGRVEGGKRKSQWLQVCVMERRTFPT